MSKTICRTTKERAPAGVAAGRVIALRLKPEEREELEKIAGDARSLNAVARELVLDGLSARQTSRN